MAEKLKLEKKKFSEWYDRILAYAEILDDRYPLKGVFVWRPYGYKALKLMLRKMEDLLEETGHQDSYFPLFSPASLFSKEKDFLEGFGGDSLIVTKIGKRKLDEELIVRPTSETIMYYMFNIWIRSWRDLPLKIFQIVPIFRWETKMTKPMFRVREIAKFKEAHTVHATKEESEEQVKEAIEIYKKFFDSLEIPYIILRTVSWDTFAGALYNYDFLTVMPNGKAIELGSVIALGQKFAKAFDIKFLDKDKKKKYVWQTCYGISERALGSTLALHGDDKGLIIMSKIAPIQIIIVPILAGNDIDKKILEKAKEIKKKLKYRVEIDNTDKNPGEKYYHWEAKGVPIRIEIGKKEIESKNVLLVRRDTGKKTLVKEKELDKTVKKTLKEIDNNLFKTSEKFLKSMITKAETIKQAEKVLNDKKGIVKLPWCGNEKCGKEMEEMLVGEALGIDEKEKTSGKCDLCKGKAKHLLYFGRTY